MNWEDYRREDGSIDLKEAFNYYYNITESSKKLDSIRRRYDYLEKIENLKSIKSRQVAATILINADYV